MKSESMKPTELTMRDVLLQEVDDTIRLIKNFKGLEGEVIPYVTDLTTLNAYFESPSSTIRFRTMTSEPNSHIPCEERAFSSIYYGSDDSLLTITSVIVRHRAVWDALCDLHPLFPAPQDLQNWVFDEFPEALGYTLSDILESPGSSSRAIPQLGALPGHIQFRQSSCRDARPLQDQYSILTPLWRVREQERFTHGIYIPLPDEFARLLPESVRNDQYPHVATKASNQGLVAYTQSPTAGMLDRQQVQKPGRYIRQHCSGLTDEQVKQAAATLIGSLSADFYHTKDANEIHRVYVEGPQSCMCADGRFDHLIVDGEQYHPTMVYAHPHNNIELVYLEVGGYIGARVLVNTAKKTYPRIYTGDSVAGAGRRMEHYLDSLGYYQCNQTLHGEKLLRVSPDANSDAIICPYLDPSNVGVGIYDDFLLVGDDNYEANYETGCLSDFDVGSRIDWHCDSCGDGYMEDDDRYTDQHEDPICSYCADDRTEAYSLRLDCIIHADDHTTLYDSDFTSYSRYAVALHLGGMQPHYYGLAELNSDLYHADYYMMLAPLSEVIDHHDGDYVRTADLDEHDLIEVDGVAYPQDECYILDGELQHDPSFDPDDENAVQFTPPSYANYPELDHYMTVPAEEAV